jgi:hypothetical protein
MAHPPPPAYPDVLRPVFFYLHERLTVIQIRDMLNMRGWNGNIPPRTVPGRSASGVFLSTCFQIINIQVNQAFLTPYFEDNPAAGKPIIISISLDCITILVYMSNTMSVNLISNSSHGGTGDTEHTELIFENSMFFLKIPRKTK